MALKPIICAVCESYEDRLTEFAVLETWELDVLEAEYQKHLETHKPDRIPFAYAEPEDVHYADA